jgi:GGDEF domain-containing protein
MFTPVIAPIYHLEMDPNYIPDQGFSKSMTDSYLALLSSLAGCVATACPPVGTPYGHRLDRLRARLGYDLKAEAPTAEMPTPEMMQEITLGVAVELADYSVQAGAYLNRYDAELHKTVEGLFETVRAMAIRQDFYCEQLRQTLRQMQETEQVVGLKSYVDSLSVDWQTVTANMRGSLAEADRRIAEGAVSDPVTGLINRREMERHLKAQTAKGYGVPTLIVFTINSGLPDEVIQQVAVRLISQFRYNDLIARWSANEFVVLFHSTPEIALSRTEQILPWLEGRYLADNGHPIEVRAEGGLMEHQMAPGR